MKKLYLIIVILICGAGVTLPAHSGEHQVQEKELTLCTATDATEVIDAYFEFLQIAYAEMGYQLRLKRFPVSRTYASVNQGAIDGLVITAKQVVDAYPNIVHVPTPLNQIHLAAFTARDEIHINGISDLGKYRIGILRGYTISKKLTEGVNRQIVNNYETLFSILKIDRIDVAIAMRREGLRFLKKSSRFEEIRELKPPLFSIPLYHCLNKKHQPMVAELDKIFIRLIENKVFEKLYQPHAVEEL